MHVYRESNHVADHLVNRGHSCHMGFHCIKLFRSYSIFLVAT
ncbi:hypothetical protein LINPERPRIM_LOCUS7928 [Linum perenne]